MDSMDPMRRLMILAAADRVAWMKTLRAIKDLPQTEESEEPKK